MTSNQNQPIQELWQGTPYETRAGRQYYSVIFSTLAEAQAWLSWYTTRNPVIAGREEWEWIRLTKDPTTGEFVPSSLWQSMENLLEVPF